MGVEGCQEKIGMNKYCICSIYKIIKIVTMYKLDISCYDNEDELDFIESLQEENEDINIDGITSAS
jgi:hypothetical protein